MQLDSTRLQLRELRSDDFAAVHAYASDPEVVRYMPWGPSGEDDTRAFLERSQAAAAAHPRLVYELAIIEKATDTLAGAMGLHVAPSGEQAMLGYCLSRAAWGRGLATEAAVAVLRFGFADLGLHRIWAGCDPENIGSRRVLEKIGMRLEGHLREDTRVRGEWRDSLLFARLRSEWTDR